MSDTIEHASDERPRKKIGPRSVESPAPDPGMGEAPKAPVATRLYVVFYFEDKHGNSGFDHVVLDGIIYVRSQEDLIHINQAITRSKPEADYYQHLCVTNWHILEK